MLTGWLGAVDGMVAGHGAADRQRDYTSDVVSSLDMQAAAFDNFIEASESAGRQPELIAPMFQLMKRAVASGYGDADQASLVEMIRMPPEPQKARA